MLGDTQLRLEPSDMFLGARASHRLFADRAHHKIELR
jgi:hypothetical protein